MKLNLGCYLSDRDDVFISIYPSKYKEDKSDFSNGEFEGEPPDYMNDAPPLEEP